MSNSSYEFWKAMFDVLNEGLCNPKALTYLGAMFFISMFLLWVDWKRKNKRK